ncbi:MAG: spiro-SPASM protein [Spirochaetales bacterium]|nr:spiro-SPASM protein [Spirochaetales bacterium]
MGNIVIINCIDLNPLALKPLQEGGSSLERVVEKAARFPKVKKTVIITSETSPSLHGEGVEGIELVSKDKWSLSDLFSFFKDCSKDYKRVFYLYGDTPLIDPEIVERMYRNHKKYFAQYSFADGYPHGLAPEILDTSILPALSLLADQDDGDIDRKSVFTVLSRDINSVDIETEISPEDLRLLRVSLTTDSTRNFLLLERVMEKGGEDEASILAVIMKSPEILRTLPAYVDLQISSGWVNKPEYLPDFSGESFDRENDQTLSLDDLAVIADKLESLSPDLVINPGFRCEPSIHPNIAGIIESLLQKQGFSLIIETSGLGWSEEVLGEIEALDTDRIGWIVGIDSCDTEVYSKLRGRGMDEAEAFFMKMREKHPGKVWVQAVRLKGYEKPLEEFYRKWKDITGDLIIQKHNDYCGVLPSLKVTDLSPMKRFPCWHIKRDLSILLDGTVLKCGQCLEKGDKMGNILIDSAESIWARGDELYMEHTRESYPSICGRCDEFYTFNF